MSGVPLRPVVLQGAVGHAKVGGVHGTVRAEAVTRAEGVERREAMIDFGQVGGHIVGGLKPALLVRNFRRAPCEVEAHKERLTLTLAIVHGEEECPVFNQGSTGACPKLLPGWSAFESKDIPRRELPVAQVIEGASVKVVRTGFRDDVDDASTAAAEFGRKVGVYDAEFLDGLLAHDESEVSLFSSARTNEEGLIEIGPVDVNGAV